MRALLDELRGWLAVMLPAELEPALAGMAADEEISTPIRIRLPVSLAELSVWRQDRELGTGGVGSFALVGAGPSRDALRRAIAQEFGGLGSNRQGREADHVAPAPGAAPDPVVPRSLRSPEVLELLVDWLRNGQLRFRLTAFTTPALQAWAVHASAHSRRSRDEPVIEPPPGTVERLAGQAHHVAAEWSNGDPKRAALIARIVVLATLESVSSGSGTAPAVITGLDQLIPVPSRDNELPKPDDGLQEAEIIVPPALAAAPQRAGSVRRVAQEWRVETALPFLLLGPLAKIGWLDTLAASLKTERAEELLPIAGVLLAHKVLPPPDRGWRRTPAAALTAAASGLLCEPPDNALLRAFARAIRHHLPGLDAVIADGLCAGHRAGAPLLLTRLGADLLLSDSDGLFPFALASEVFALAPVLSRLPREAVLVPAETATRSILAELNELGVRFATDAPPGRGEGWRMLNRRWRDGVDLWTNDETLAPSSISNTLTSASAEASDSWQEIALKRRALASFDYVALETSFGLAVSLALGSVAWELWRRREAVAPNLALERFAGFDAVVRADDAAVTVTLPLGSRFFDLREHGFLDDVHGVSWFGGRVLQFRSG